jgi:hypothetical protein
MRLEIVFFNEHMQALVSAVRMLLGQQDIAKVVQIVLIPILHYEVRKSKITLHLSYPP